MSYYCSMLGRGFVALLLKFIKAYTKNVDVNIAFWKGDLILENFVGARDKLTSCVFVFVDD